jgi:D-alanine-D-alanine ligase
MSPEFDSQMIQHLPRRVALIFGGVSPEHEISILSASQVAVALGRLAGATEMSVFAVYINRDGEWVWREGNGMAPTEAQVLEAKQWDCRPDEFGVEVMPFTQGLDRLKTHGVETALLILHGANGEDGRLQGALDLAGIAYSGSGALASAVCLNKPRCQAVLNAARLPIATSIVLHASNPGEPERIVQAVGLPLVIKPAAGGSSVGMTIVRETEQIPAALELAFQVDDEVLAESFVKGQEFTAGVLERLKADGTCDVLALPIVQIVPPEGHYYDYESKYFDDRTQYLVPAPISDALSLRMQELALRAHRACGCRGFSRVDFLCDASAAAEPTILELNTLPGMTSHSLLPKAAGAVGIDYATLVGLMLNSARHD